MKMTINPSFRIRHLFTPVILFSMMLPAWGNPGQVSNKEKAVSKIALSENYPGNDPSSLSPHLENNTTIPEYRDHMVHLFERATQGVKLRTGRYDPGAAQAALMLWEATGREEFLGIGQTLFANIMIQSEGEKAGTRWTRKYGDFDSYPIVYSAFLLERHGWLDQKWKAMLLEECVALQKKGLSWRHGNRELGKLAGPIFAAFQFFPSALALSPLRTQAREWWRELNAVGCLDESSGNYSSLGLSLLILIAKSMDCETDLKSNPQWLSTFRMYRDLVSPSGHMPEWGDDYFAEGGKLTWCYLFEYAANLYQEPAFSLAARRLFFRQLNEFKTQSIVKMGGLRQALDMLNVQCQQTVSPLPFVSGVNYRNNAAGVTYPFSLLMRPDLNPGSPMIMMDLYSLSDHAHMEKRGSITYYESNHVPLFHGRNRNHGRHAGDGGNNFYLQPEADSFPFQPWEKDTWYTVRVPAERFGYAGKPGKGADRLFTQYYGNFKNKKGATLFLDNLRLEGPNGIQMIDAFDDLDSGTYSTGHYVKDQADRTVLEIPGEATSFRMKNYNTLFDPDDYRILAYDIKWTGPEIPDIGFRYNEDSLNMYNAWHSPDALRPFYADLKSAKVNMHHQDCYGAIEFTGYGTWDTPHTRHLVLTWEGALIIRDSVAVGQTADQWTGGEIWQFQEKNAQGENWFAGKLQSDSSCIPNHPNAYQRGMLVLFDRSDHDIFDAKQVPWGKTRQRWLAYTKFNLRARQRYVRTVVVVPYNADQQPAQVAGAISVTTTALSSQVVLQGQEYKRTIVINDQGRWRVTRTDNQSTNMEE